MTYLLGRQTQPLPLESSNPCPTQSAISNPTIGVCPRVTSRHPSQELAVVDNEIGKRELMRVEQEWRNTKTENGDPEVDDVWDEDRHGNVQ